MSHYSLEVFVYYYFFITSGRNENDKSNKMKEIQMRVSKNYR
jgi:hypothetical protein